MFGSMALAPLLLLALCMGPIAGEQTVALPPGPNCTREAVARDFNGDGSSDIVAVGDGSARIQLMQGWRRWPRFPAGPWRWG